MKAEWTNKDSLTSGETTKAILVIDTPNDCYECPCYYEDKDMCEAFDKKAKADSGRPSWCPLRPLPQKYDEAQMREQKGWNRCLDEILGETECTTQKKDTSM